MKIHKTLLCVLGIFIYSGSYSQMGKNGARTVTALNTIVNEYTTLTADAAAGATTLQVASSSLNSNSRFTSNLSAGDLLMIIQIQGASVTGTASGTITIPNDITWGSVTSYNNCGNYELVQVYAVPNATSIQIDCGLKNNYTAAGKVQVVRVPRYSTLTVNSGSGITCDAWNGSIGGVVAIEASSITNNGQIIATGKGFRGGQLTGNDSFWNLTNYATISTDGGGEKGEGIYGYQAEYNVLGGSIGRGAPANGGGGANGWTTGGGGGANAGNINTWNGQGNPNTSVAGWVNAWNLESAGFATNTSSGGGRGGYSFSSNNQNATTVAPGNTGWGGDNRMNHGGLGGRPLDYSTGKIFLGGGGGAGDQDNSFGGVGGAGGGLIYLQSYGTVTGTGTIVSNGNAGGNATGTPANNSTFAGKDAAGGGGAGGTILIRSQGTSGVSINANGGAGGSQIIVKGAFVFTVNEAEGPGGGGGGGYIGLSAGTPVQTVTGGANGTSNSDALTEFLPNGATMGGAGLSGQTLTNYEMTAVNASICSGSTAALSVNVTGTPPAGYTVQWFDAQVGGNVVGTGTTFTTPVLTATTIFYAAICPGFYRIPVTATVVPGITVNVTPVNSSSCSGGSVSLTATGATTYSWNPSATLSAATGASVNASPASTTTYTVTGTSGTCYDTAVAIVNVSTAPVITVTPASSTICNGSSVALSASGGLTYTWNPSTGLSSVNTANVTAAPTSTITYTVTGTNAGGCTGTATVPVTVTPLPTVTVSPATNTICDGSSVTLAAAGASTYSWTPGTALNTTSGATVIATPSSTITYTVSGTTSGCSAASTTIVTVTLNPSVTVSPVSSAMCAGSSTALTASGGTTYTWNPATGLSGTSTASVTANPAATTTYTVTGTTSGCTDTAVTIVNVYPVPVITVTPATSAICSGNTVTLNAAGGSTYSWSPSTALSATSGASVTADPSSTITYTVTGTSAQGCSDTAYAIVNVTPLPVVSVTPATTSICSGGTVSMTASGATTYAWSPSTSLSATTGATVNASPSVTITYTVTGTQSGCSATATSVVTVTPSITVTVTPAASSVCSGSSVSLTASGGTTYTWNPSATLSASNTPAVTATPSATTTYTVTGTVAGGCTDTATVIVTVNSIPVVAVTPTSSAVCAGSSVSITANGANSYSWTPSTGLNTASGASVIATPSSTITYTVTGTTTQGCTDTAYSVVNVNAVPAVAITPANSTICQGGSVSLSASGAATYEWSPATGLNTTSGSNVTADPSATITYTVTGTSAGCSDTATVIVNVAGSLTVSSLPADTTICSGSSVSISAAGATNYTWSPATGLSSTTGQTVIASPATSTTYTLTGISGTCSDTVLVPVIVDPVPVISLTVSDTSICSSESVQFDVTGSASSYTWNGPALSSTTGTSVTALPNATSTYTVIGSLGTCSDTLTQEIDVEPVPVVSVTPASATVCPGESVVLNASGAATYEWGPSTGLSATSGAIVTANPASSTTYTVTGTTGGCTDTSVVEISVVTALNASASSSEPSICPGDTTILTASGGATYSWSPSSGLSSTTGSVVNANPSSTTTYTVIASSGSCSDTAEVIVKVNTVPVLSLTVNSDTICEGSSATIDVTGATSYQWSPSATLSSATAATVQATPSATETYTVIGFNLTCSDTLTQVIVVENNPVISVIQSTDTICSGSSMVFTASGAVSYEWSPVTGLSGTTGSTVTAAPAASTTYTVTGTTGNCSATQETYIEVINVTVSSNVTSATICEGDSVHLLATGALTYTLSPSTGVTEADTGDYYIKPPATTTYELVGSLYGCTDTVQIPVTVTSAPVITVTSGPQTICEGGSTTITVSGATSYMWSPSAFVDNDTSSTVTATPSVTTTYTVAGFTGSCGTMDTVIINVTQVNLVATTSSSSVCPGGTATLTATGADTYVWFPSAELSSSSGSSVIATPSATSTYSVAGTDLNGCADTATVSVEVLSVPSAAAGSDITTCQSSETLSATDPTPLNGTWNIVSGSGSIGSPSDPNAAVSGLSAGTTVITWTVTNSCGSDIDTVTIVVTSGPDVNVTAAPLTICPGESSTLSTNVTGGTAPYSYAWSNGVSTSSQSVAPSVPTTYSVQVTDVNGCTSSQESVTVDVGSAPVVDAGTDVTIIKGESTQLTASGASTYSWTPANDLTAPASSTTTASPMVTTVYTVTGTDANGCSATDSVTVNVEEKTNVFVPDIFSPNNDGRNDVLYVRGGNIKSFRFLVFDRWGEKVFETEDQKEGWDGTLRGRPMDEAVYVFILKGTYLDGSTFEINGNVTLIR